MKRCETIFPAAIRGRYTAAGGGIEQHLELRPDSYTNTITCVQKDNVLVVWKEEDADGRKTD